MDADKISYDSIKDILSASGNVVVTQNPDSGNKRVLHSEKIDYNRKTGKISLYGHSVIEESNGDKIDATNIEIDDNFKKGIIKALKVVLNDESKIKATSGKKEGDIFYFSDATYTPCFENPNCKFPLWDLRADSVVYDTSKKKFTYKNVSLRMKGQTILYTPYFEHPAFDVKRKSGFLTPILSSNNDTGVLIGVPYYFAISPDKDFKITPFIMFKKRALASAEYRQAFKNGDFKLGGSFLTKSDSKNTHEEEKKNRWHISASYKTKGYDNKRFKMNVNRVSDVAYLLKYPVNDMYRGTVIRRKTTKTDISFDFFDKNYFYSMSSYFFQAPNDDAIPMAVPIIKIEKNFDDVLGGIISFSNDTVHLSRKNFEEENRKIYCDNLFRSSNKISYEKNIFFNHFVTDIYSSVKADIYHAKTPILNSVQNDSNSFSKTYPVLENIVSWKFPLKGKFLNKTCIFSPKVSLSSFVSENSRKTIPINEDSIFDNFSDITIFDLNKFTGTDLPDVGEKLTYGFESSVYTEKRRFLDLFVGHSVFIQDRNYEKRRGRKSIVGRFVVRPSEILALRLRFVGMPLIQKIFVFETGASLKIKKFKIDCGYFFDQRRHKLRQEDISTLGVSVGYNFYENWDVFVSNIINLKKSRQSMGMSRGIFLKYKDECFEFGCGLYKSNYKDMDINPKTGFMFCVTFKNIGGISQSVKRYAYDSLINKIY